MFIGMASKDYSAPSGAQTTSPEQPLEATRRPKSPPRRGGLAIVPILGNFIATSRLLRDRDAALWAKLLVVAAIAYVIFPLDAVPDLAPLVGWLDDAGVVVAVRILLHRQLANYRYPLGESPPPRPLKQTPKREEFDAPRPPA